MIVVACGGDSTPSGTSSGSDPPPATSSTTSTIAATTTTTTASTTTSTTSTTTTTVAPEPDCDRDVAIDILDDTIALARLAAGDDWTEQTTGAAFDDRTNPADEFAARLAYDCALRLTQRVADGGERLALIAWNDRRHATVIQATDAPSESFRPDARFQLFIEQPFGEFLVDQFVWAATMEGGESIVLGTDDYSIAITAKSWQSAVPRFEDLPVTLDAERFAIDTLRAAGARNVSVAEPAPFGYPIGAIQFNTPWALNGFAAIGPVDSFDPMVPIVADGETTFHDVDGVEVRLTTGLEMEMFVLHEAGWRCGAYSWRLEATLGSPGELLEYAEILVRSLDC
jgi:hypothetical protein